MADWIEKFMAYTSGLPSPESFRLWSAITAVSGALERRVWAETAQNPIYPNIFTLLVGPPASGKSQAINPVGQMWYDTKKIHVAPDNMTSASLVDALEEADRKIVVPGGMVEYHSLGICCSELGVLLPAHDLAFLSILNLLYDNPGTYREKRRTLNKESDITRPQVTILAGSQPGFMASLFPEEAWSMGFTSRIIMVYSGTVPKVSLFDNVRPPKADRDDLVTGLADMASLMGEAKFSPEAKAELSAWHNGGHDPVPEHSKLEHYIGRRILHVIKLSIISAASRGNTILIEHEDVGRAMGWLLEAERRMPDIFRQMVGKSDVQALQELHFYAWNLYSKEGKPLHESRLVHFLSNQVPSDKIPKLLETADKAKIISRQAGSNLWIPQPKHKHGME